MISRLFVYLVCTNMCIWELEAQFHNPKFMNGKDKPSIHPAEGCQPVNHSYGCTAEFHCCSEERFLTAKPQFRAALNRTVPEGKIIEMLVFGDNPYQAPAAAEATLAAHPITVEYDVDGQPSNLLFRLFVYRISKIDQKAQTFDMHYRVTALWRDCRLISGCESVILGSGHPNFAAFWSPMIVFHEEEIKESSESSLRSSFFEITGTGMVKWGADHYGTFRCPMDFGNMPFDRNTCTLTVSSVGIPRGRMQMIWGSVGSEKLTNAEWDIDQGDVWVKTSYADVKTDTDMSSRVTHEVNLKVTFTIKRDPNYCLITFILPSIFFYLISWVGLWIDIAAVPARAMMAVIPVLILTNKVNELHTSLPPISYLTRLTIFLGTTSILLVVHTVTFGFCQYAFRRILQLEKKLHKLEKDAIANVDTEQAGSVRSIGSVLSDGGVALLALTAWERRLLKFLKVFNKHWEIHERWISPCILFAVTLIVFLPVA